MKLIRLRSVANNAIRDSIWTSEYHGPIPTYHFGIKHDFTVDLLTGKLTPDMKGDDIEEYYQAMSKWFHRALEKEGIPLEIIEEAVIYITPNGRKCVIKANGRTFES